MGVKAGIEDSKRETIVFAYDTEEERRAILDVFPGWWEREKGSRIVALSHDSEITRIDLIQNALERYNDPYDFRDAIEAILGHPNLSRFKWSDIDASDAT